ncbi:type 1 fimbrial protein [Enterobacter cloacae]|nr:type 1 fimbrial protein [Enterobacter cloacae]
MTFKGTVKAPTCSIPASALNFQMGSVTEKSFGSAVGPVSAVAGQTINLTVTCDASLQPKIKMEGSTVSGMPTVFALSTATGSATGFGIVFSVKGTTINNGGTITLPAATSQSVPIVASYYQTQPIVYPGNVNASATLSLSYN